jgi:hypothetical protein
MVSTTNHPRIQNPHGSGFSGQRSRSTQPTRSASRAFSTRLPRRRVWPSRKMVETVRPTTTCYDSYFLHKAYRCQTLSPVSSQHPITGRQGRQRESLAPCPSRERAAAVAVLRSALPGATVPPLENAAAHHGSAPGCQSCPSRERLGTSDGRAVGGPCLYPRHASHIPPPFPGAAASDSSSLSAQRQPVSSMRPPERPARSLIATRYAAYASRLPRMINAVPLWSTRPGRPRRCHSSTRVILSVKLFPCCVYVCTRVASRTANRKRRRCLSCGASGVILAIVNTTRKPDGYSATMPGAWRIAAPPSGDTPTTLEADESTRVRNFGPDLSVLAYEARILS